MCLIAFLGPSFYRPSKEDRSRVRQTSRRFENRIGPIACTSRAVPMQRVRVGVYTHGNAATPRIKRRNNEPLFTGYFFFPHSLSSRWTPIWKTTCRNLRCSRSASSARSALMLSRSLFLHSLLLFISISFSLSFSPPSPSSSTVSRLLSLEIEIAPSCAMRRFASELSIDWQTVDAIDKVRDTLPIGRLNPLRSCIVTCQSP